MEKILITGGTGFLGANLIHRLLKSKNEIITIIKPNSNEWRISEVKNKIKVYHIDILNEKKISNTIKEIKPSLIFHCATYGVNPSQDNFGKIFQTNVFGTNNIFSTIQKINCVKKIINFGSSFEYAAQKLPVKETDIISPTTVYGISKATQTNLAQYYAENLGLPIVTARIFTPYGKYDSNGRLFSDLMISAIKGRQIKLGFQDSFRDFIHIDDAVDILLLIVKDMKNKTGIFNIGTGKKSSVKQIMRLCEKKMKIKYHVSWGNETNIRKIDRFSEVVIADMQKTQHVFHWKPKITIDEGIKKTYSWYLKNFELYK